MCGRLTTAVHDDWIFFMLSTITLKRIRSSYSVPSATTGHNVVASWIVSVHCQNLTPNAFSHKHILTKVNQI